MTKKTYTHKLFLESPTSDYVVSALSMFVSMMIADYGHSELTEWAYSNDVVRTMHQSEVVDLSCEMTDCRLISRLGLELQISLV